MSMKRRLPIIVIFNIDGSDAKQMDRSDSYEAIIYRNSDVRVEW